MRQPDHIEPDLCLDGCLAFRMLEFSITESLCSGSTQRCMAIEAVKLLICNGLPIARRECCRVEEGRQVWIIARLSMPIHRATALALITPEEPACAPPLLFFGTPLGRCGLYRTAGQTSARIDTTLRQKGTSWASSHTSPTPCAGTLSQRFRITIDLGTYHQLTQEQSRPIEGTQNKRVASHTPYTGPHCE